MITSLRSTRAQRPDTVALWKKISTVEDKAWTARYHSIDPNVKAFGGRVGRIEPRIERLVPRAPPRTLRRPEDARGILYRHADPNRADPPARSDEELRVAHGLPLAGRHNRHHDQHEPNDRSSQATP